MNPNEKKDDGGGGGGRASVPASDDDPWPHDETTSQVVVKEEEEEEEEPRSQQRQQIINLNVGGSKFTTSRDTLCRGGSSASGGGSAYFAAMFSGRHRSAAQQLGDDGYYFIDRDGRHFRHILNYLRHGGAVVTLPSDPVSKQELAVEADFYGCPGLVKALCTPQMDYTECAPQLVVSHWNAEERLRQQFFDGTAREFCRADPYHGLVPLFATTDQEEDVGHTMPLMFDPHTELRQNNNNKDCLFLSSIRGEDQQHPVQATVATLDEFHTNFNREWPNLLHRLGPVLQQENVVVAGGAVMRALTATPGMIRTADYWHRKEVWDSGFAASKHQSDVDLFLYACSKQEASRIARRIFYALAVDHETWVVVRGRGVINISECVRDRWSSRMGMKIQIVLRIYDSPSEVLLGFDLDSCCCAYNGRNVWVCPRWISSLQSGLNVLNPLHAWLNKASYEMRLAKYAFRGFAVLVPGIDRKRIDYNRIQQSKLSELKGLARFIKISSEMESATPFKWREFADEDAGNLNLVEHEQPRVPMDVPNLRLEARNLITEDADRLIDVLDSEYNDEDIPLVRTSRCIVPQVYPVLLGSRENGTVRTVWAGHHLWAVANNANGRPTFPNAQESRDEAWREIEDAGEDVPQSVPRLLRDAWDASKRSREYLNGQMKKYDLDNVYYSSAY